MNNIPISAENELCRCFKETNACSKEINPRKTLKKLAFLLDSPLATDMLDRQEALLQEYIKSADSGVMLADLIYFIKCLERMTSKSDVPMYKPYLQSLIKLCAIPPIVQTSSEEIDCIFCLEKYFTVLAYMIMCLDEPQTKKDIIIALENLLKKSDRKSVKLTLRHMAAEQSLLPEVTAELLKVSQIDIYTNVLSLSLLLTQISSTICKKMLIEGAIDTLMLYFATPEHRCSQVFTSYPIDTDDALKDYVSDSSAIIWNILINIKHLNLSQEELDSLFKPTQDTIWHFHYTLRTMILKKCKKFIRNDNVMLITLYISIFPICWVSETGLADDIALLCVATENGTQDSWAEDLVFLPTNDDLIFKKRLLLCACQCATLPAMPKIMRERRVIEGILELINPHLKPVNIQWSAAQFYDLLIFVINCLPILAPFLPDVFIKNNGFARFLMLIEIFVIEKYKAEILSSILSATSSLVTGENKRLFIEDLREKSAIRCLIKLVDYFFNEKIILTTEYQLIVTYSLSILCQICENHDASKNDYGSASVDLVIKCLKRILHPQAQDTKIDNRLAVCLGDFIWEMVIWNPENLKLFRQKGGVYAILDIIEMEIFPVQLLFLGALVDLCDEGSCIPHLITWRGGPRRKTTLLSLLLSIFRKETAYLEVKCTPDGIIADIELPIMGKEQWHKTYYLDKEVSSSPSAVDMLASARPKIYAIIQMLQTRHLERLNIANEHYRMYNTELNTKDQVMMKIAENFLALKFAEVWAEVKVDLKKAGIKPLGCDGHMLQIIMDCQRKWAIYIKNEQLKVFTDFKEKECKREKELHEMLRENRLALSLDAYHELNYIARTCDSLFRKGYKMRQRNEVNKSLSFPIGINDNYIHRTYMQEIEVNDIFNQHVYTENIKLFSSENVNKL